jgi:hypothetical protein
MDLYNKLETFNKTVADFNDSNPRPGPNTDRATMDRSTSDVPQQALPTELTSTPDT